MQAYSFPTVETAVDQAIAETIGSSSSALTALQNTALIRQMDVINRRFITEGHIRHPSGGWSWMEDVTNFQTKTSTTINGALTTASTSFVVTADIGFDASSGRVWIKTSKGAIDFVDYATFSTLTASTVTDIDIAHATAEKIEKCYALPSTYGKAHRLILGTTEYRHERSDGLLPPSGTYFTRGAFIVLPEGIGTQDATFWFEKAPTDLSTGSESPDLARSLDIPEDFFRYPVEMLKAYIYMIRRKEDKAQLSLQLAEDALQNALSYDISSTTPQGLSVGW